jgi:4-amino-4-deoxy-L-arabinose transferase-like glycosyltransferase
MRFAIGATIESLLIYVCLLLRLPIWWLAAFIPALFFIRSTSLSELPTAPLDRLTHWIVFPVFAIFGGYYLVQAMAPEIQPDAISYHLGLTAEYLRLGTFPKRIGFYEILPQGLEMLFAMAMLIGRDSAAKLVHFAFLLATLPLIVLTARRLKLTDTQGYTAALLYLVTPVVGLSGTCAYNDAALVFFTLATFYLLLLDQPGCAGITAGFCYAIKFTGLLVPVLAMAYVLWTRRSLRPAIRLTIGALLMTAPWMLRALILTRNPLAPLFNGLFPNLYFNPVSEHNLTLALSSYNGFTWPHALWIWGIDGAAQGVVGPLILVAPLALLTLRKQTGRLLLIASLLLLVPLAFNTGTRFLMPSLPFLALALATALPRPAFLALAVLQAVVCFPPVVRHLERPQAWALKGFPWRAALRLQSEPEYLQSAASDYTVARFIEDNTTQKDRIFALCGISTLYTAREVLEYWHSDRSQRYTAALQTAFMHTLTVNTHAEWQPILLSGIRFVSTADLPLEWSIFDVRLFSPGGFLYNSPQWTLIGSPNPADAAAAFDGNRTTFWTTRIPQRRGMFLEADFDHPQLLDSAQFLIAANAPQPGFAVEGRFPHDRNWKFLTDRFNGKVQSPQDLRRDAVHALHLADFSVIAVYANGDGLGAIGLDMAKHPAQWSLQDLGGIGDFHLMKISEP